MRIAVYHNLPSGGGKRALFEWVRRLAGEHEIDVYSLGTADHAYCDIRPYTSQYKLYEFTPHSLFKSPFGRLNQFQRSRDLGQLEQLNREIARQIDAGGYDVLFANACIYTFIPALVCFAEISSVYYLHEPFGPSFLRRFKRPYIPNNHWRELLDRFDPLIWMYQRRLSSIQKRSIRKSKRLLANSQFTSECIRTEYGQQAVFCPYGVNVQDFHPVMNLPREGFVVSVGELSPRKGFDFIVESLGRIPEAHRPALKLACNMVHAEESRYVKNLAERNGVSLEVLVGLGVEELRSLYNRARLCVYAPVMEPFGLVPLEAMACGTPVIGVREGGVQESVVHEQTGLLVERDAQQFGETIQYMLENPGLAATYGRNGREHVINNWTWERSVSILGSHLVDCAGLSK